MKLKVDSPEKKIPVVYNDTIRGKIILIKPIGCYLNCSLYKFIATENDPSKGFFISEVFASLTFDFLYKMRVLKLVLGE